MPFANRKRILLFYLAKILETILVILSLLIIYNQLYHIAVTKVSNILFSNSIHNVFQTAFLGAIASRKGHSCSTNPTHANHSGRYSQNKKIVDKSIIHCWICEFFFPLFHFSSAKYTLRTREKLHNTQCEHAIYIIYIYIINVHTWRWHNTCKPFCKDLFQFINTRIRQRKLTPQTQKNQESSQEHRKHTYKNQQKRKLPKIRVFLFTSAQLLLRLGMQTPTSGLGCSFHILPVTLSFNSFLSPPEKKSAIFLCIISPSWLSLTFRWLSLMLRGVPSHPIFLPFPPTSKL